MPTPTEVNALLAERLEDSPGRRLSRIIEDNSVRIDRVIAAVLSVSRRERPSDETIAARLRPLGIVQDYSPPEALAARIAQEFEAMSTLVKPQPARMP